MRYSRKTNSVQAVGEWETSDASPSSSSSLHVTNGTLMEEPEADAVTLRVVTKEEKPYVMRRKDKMGNEAYDGFAIDLLKVGLWGVLLVD